MTQAMPASLRKPLPASATPDATVEARVTALNYDGAGVARVDGKVTFIDDALPGETVRLRYLRRRKNFDTAELVEVLTPSPDRVVPACSHFGTCGGCGLQHLRPAAQILAKQKILAEQLKHIGQVEPETWLAPLTGPAWGYRRRARLGVREVPSQGGVLVGFRERRKSYLANLNECPVLDARLAVLLPALRALIARLSCPQRIPQIEVAAGDNFAGSEIGRASARPEGGRAKDGAHHDAVALVFRHLVALTDTDRERLRDFGARHALQIYLQGGGPDSIAPLEPEAHAPLSYRLPDFDVTLQFRPTDFIQVNHALNRKLVRQALTLLALAPQDRVLDLFCGLGNFTLPLARRAEHVLGIDADAGLIAGARANADRNGLGNAVFRDADLYTESAAEAPWHGFGFNKVLLDPPRNGAIEVLKRLPPDVARVVYVSCYPATLARDAAYLVRAHGLRLAAAGAVDMFPHTRHVESMALFLRP